MINFVEIATSNGVNFTLSSETLIAGVIENDFDWFISVDRLVRLSDEELYKSFCSVEMYDELMTFEEFCDTIRVVEQIIKATTMLKVL